MKTFWLPWSSLRTTAVWGLVCWIGLIAVHQPILQSDQWARLLLQLAMLVWVPLGLSFLMEQSGRWRYLLLPAALCGVISLQQPAGPVAALWALPWFLVTAILFVSGIEQLFRARRRVSTWAMASAQIFILIGGLSLLADRLNLEPLGFDPAIVLLTAVHFHYAGFVFLLLLGLAAAQFPGRLFRWAAVLAVVSVPLTAAGITLAQTSRFFALEAMAAATVVVAGWLGALGYLQLARRKNLPVRVRFCWAGMAFCLMFSLSLGLGYALRPYFATEFLSLPAMRAWHGTVNGLGLAGFGFLGWLQLPEVRFKTHSRN